MDGKLNDEIGREGLRHEFDASTKRTLQVDVERYQKYLDDSDMSEAEKKEFLQSLWSIIVSFVELGYGVHPVQEVCGKDAGIGTKSAEGAPDGLALGEARDDDDAHGVSDTGSLELE